MSEMKQDVELKSKEDVDLEEIERHVTNMINNKFLKFRDNLELSLFKIGYGLKIEFNATFAPLTEIKKLEEASHDQVE